MVESSRDRRRSLGVERVGAGYVPRLVAFPHKLAADVLVWGFAPVLAYLFRFDGAIPAEFVPGMLWFAGIGVAIKIIALLTYKLNQQSWKHASFRDSVAVMRAAAIVGAAEVALGLLIALALPLPRGVLPLTVLLGLIGLFGVRALRRVLHTKMGLRAAVSTSTSRRRAIVIGAGEAGHMVVRELLRHPQAGILPVAILDDDTRKFGLRIDGVRVVGRVERLGALLREGLADEVVIAIASIDGTFIRHVRKLAADVNPEIPVRLIPGVYEVLAGDVRVSRLREVQIEDLLRRPSVPVDLVPVCGYVDGRTVLVTGAGGSIGSEIVRQLARCTPERVIALGHGENSIFELERDLERIGATVAVIPVIADVRDPDRLRVIFERYRPHVVFHAAAHKHLPLMESNPEQGVLNNIGGTNNVLEQALASGVERLVNISTDKAVNPSSVLGATKRLAECLVKAAAERAGAGEAFVSVRFGNVLGSRGSVLRVFGAQISRGGPLTVTHPEMTRYFMTIPEACQLVLQAGALAKNGSTYLLDMGQPVHIKTLAEDLIRLSGYRPHDDIEIVYSGIRPGEKMHEELLTESENATPTAHPSVWSTRADDLAGLALTEVVETLRAAATAGRRDEVRRLLRKAVPYVAEDVGDVQVEAAD